MPRVEENVTRAERHHQEAHDQVGTGQGADEVVGDRLQALEPYDGGDDQHVAKDDSQNQQCHQDAY